MNRWYKEIITDIGESIIDIDYYEWMSNIIHQNTIDNGNWNFRYRSLASRYRYKVTEIKSSVDNYLWVSMVVEEGH